MCWPPGESAGCQETNVTIAILTGAVPNLALRLWSGCPKTDCQVPQAHPSSRPFSSLRLQDKQNEASYLRDHKEELTEELATTILQKVGGPGVQWLQFATRAQTGSPASWRAAVGTVVVLGIISGPCHLCFLCSGG